MSIRAQADLYYIKSVNNLNAKNTSRYKRNHNLNDKQERINLYACKALLNDRKESIATNT
jgi:hypothetical protein